MVISILFLMGSVLFVNAGCVVHPKKENKMQSQFLEQVARALLHPHVTFAEIENVMKGDVERMPPNQAHIKLSGRNGISAADVVFSKDNDPKAPINIVIIAFENSSDLKLGDLEATFGHWTVEGEERRPSATEPVTFSSKSAHGIDLRISARVKRPASAGSQVTSIEFVRTADADVL
jgi:hypothetical protein